MRLLSLFSGIGAFEKALENIGEPFETVAYCEIDKYASKAFALIHHVDESKNLRDVCSINTNELPKDIDLITYGFPCQDISLAGMQKGFYNEDGGLTRSGLFFTALHIIEETKPKIAIAENVKALTSKKFASEFKTVLDCLNDAGYENSWAVLNAKDYGIPQNRERVFIVSIRKDLAHGFEFPKKQELTLRLKDLLEDNVEEKYFLSEKMIQGFINHNSNHEAKGTGFKWKPKTGEDIANCLRANGALAPTDNTIIDDRIITVDETSDCLYIKEATSKGYKEAHDGDYVNLQYPNSETRRGRVGEQIANTLICNDGNGVVIRKPMPINTMPDGTCRTIKSQYFKTSIANFEKTTTFGATGAMDSLGIRKLTPKECFRLMGFDDQDCDILVANGISNTQLYKMAGNSIVVDVLENIFQALFLQYSDVFPNNIKSDHMVNYFESDWESRQISIFDLIKEQKNETN